MAEITTREDLIEKIIGKNPYLMKSTCFVNNASILGALPGDPKWVWSRRRLKTMPLKNLQVLYQDLCMREKEIEREKTEKVKDSNR